MEEWVYSGLGILYHGLNENHIANIAKVEVHFCTETRAPIMAYSGTKSFFGGEGQDGGVPVFRDLRGIYL